MCLKSINQKLKKVNKLVLIGLILDLFASILLTFAFEIERPSLKGEMSVWIGETELIGLSANPLFLRWGLFCLVLGFTFQIWGLLKGK